MSGDFHQCDCGSDEVGKCDIIVLGLLLTSRPGQSIIMAVITIIRCKVVICNLISVFSPRFSLLCG